VSRLNVSALSMALGLAFGTCAMAASMTEEQYKAGRDAIAAEAKGEKAACGSFAGNARDICKAEADGREKVARAELEAGYKPSVDANYKLYVARAEAAYAVAKEKCDDKSGNVKNVCVKEAKADRVAAKTDAKAQMKTSDARKDAATDKRDADYAVAKEKCDAFAGDAKSSCMSDAKARYGKT